MMSTSLRFATLASLALFTASPLMAAELFRDDLSSGAGWGVNATSADYAATFGYDYSADDIPEAPNSQGGDSATTGLKAESNLADGALQAFTAYPTGQSFSGSYQLRFDAWINYDADERINGGSSGTTEFMGGGIGYDNTSADVGAGAQLVATGDGGSGSDWRAFADGTFLAAADMVAGDRNGFNAHYSNFLPGVAPPFGQAQNDFPAGTAGSPGFQWVTYEFNVNAAAGTVGVVLEKPNGDRRAIVVMDDSNDLVDNDLTLEGNIGLFYADFFSSVTSRPDITFGLFDNVVVSTIPEPATGLLAAFGGCLMAIRRRVR